MNEKKQMKIEKLTDYINNTEKLNKIVREIYEFTSHLSKYYPNYKNWFYNKQIKESLIQKREIFFIKDKQKIIACLSLKKEPEKKICTIYVDKEYQNKGIGTALLEKSFSLLQTRKPIFSCNQNVLPAFQKIILKYHWKLEEVVKNYNKKDNEYCYNGKISKETSNTLTSKL